MKFDYAWLEPQRMKYGLTIKKDEVEARETSGQVKTSENDRKPSTGKPPIPTASALFVKQNVEKWREEYSSMCLLPRIALFCLV